MHEFLLFLRALLRGWITAMSTVLAVILSFIGWFYISGQDIKPFVLAASGLAFLFAVYRAWCIEHRIAESASGRPDVTLSCSPNPAGHGAFDFALRNSSDHVAVNINAMSISIPIPGRIMEGHEHLRNQFGDAGNAEPLPTHWIVRFGVVQRLARDEASNLPYEIDNIGVLQRSDLKYVLGNASHNWVSRITFILEFSNISEPKRTWHSHYELIYRVGSDVLEACHTSIVRVDTCGPRWYRRLWRAIKF